MSIAESNSNAIEHTAGLRWWPVLLCLFVLMMVTISPPEDFKVSGFGTQSILPPAVLKLSKLVGRGLAIVVLIFCLVKATERPTFWKSFNALLPMFAFAAFGILSVLWSAEKSISLKQSGSFSILMLLAWLIAIYWSGEKDTSYILGFTSIVLVCISLGLIILHFAVPGVGALTRRSSGLFHSTAGGATASLALVTLFSCRVIWGWQWTKQLIVPGAVIHIASMLVGANRLSLALAVVVCGAAFCFGSKLTSVAMAALCAAIVGTLYICLDPGLLVSDGIIEKINEFSVQGQTKHQLGNLSGRAEMWEKIWDSYLQSPWIGHGYFVTSESGRIFVWGEWGNWTAHNLFLQLIVTLGIVGALPFVIGIGSIVFRVFGKIGSADVSTHRLALLLSLMATWYVGWGMLNESFLGPMSPESIMFGVTLGLGAALAIETTATVDCDPSTLPVGAQE
jgi:O-antigen ligase